MAVCNQMIRFQVPLPPAEEVLNIPAELTGSRQLFGGKSAAICGNPVPSGVLFIADEMK